MHMKINSQVLAEGIKKVEKVVNGKHSIPVLRGIFMECTNDEVILIGSDTHESIRVHIPVGQNIDVLSPGKCVITKQVGDLVKKLKTSVEMNLQDMNLLIRYGKKSEFHFTILDAEEYPRLPHFDLEKPTLTLKGEDFQSIIKKTAFAAADTEIRPVLQGVNLLLKGECIQFTSTDSHRLGQVKYSLNEKIGEDLQLVIAAKALEKIIKTFDSQDDVNVYCVNNQVIFKNGPLFFYSRLLEGKYPDTSKLIPTEFESEMKIHRLEFLNSLDRISGLSEETGVVKLHINGAASLSSNQTQVGKGQETIEYEELTGEDDFTIAFSSKYMTDALKSFDDEYVVFKFCGSVRPFIVTPSASSFDEVQLILPIRTV
ncbi:DNA polymerase III subunit beta [Caldifermentibacillus hisashii]|uniref:DNA polymerase III subunit beta n=2 Tax=Bacillati TaxID=1783272 RepID=UPI0022B9AE08|nr:DNA polymerase III subunit beta [Caldifermentibacillus hisashii]